MMMCTSIRVRVRLMAIANLHAESANLRLVSGCSASNATTYLGRRVGMCAVDAGTPSRQGRDFADAPLIRRPRCAARYTTMAV